MKAKEYYSKAVEEGRIGFGFMFPLMEGYANHKLLEVLERLKKEVEYIGPTYYEEYYKGMYDRSEEIIDIINSHLKTLDE